MPSDSRVKGIYVIKAYVCVESRLLRDQSTRDYTHINISYDEHGRNYAITRRLSVKCIRKRKDCMNYSHTTDQAFSEAFWACIRRLRRGCTGSSSSGRTCSSSLGCICSSSSGPRGPRTVSHCASVLVLLQSQSSIAGQITICQLKTPPPSVLRISSIREAKRETHPRHIDVG